MIHPDDEGFTYASDAEIDRYVTYDKGAALADHAWILSDRDVWYRNPHYAGPPQRHPEDEDDAYDGEPKIDCPSWDQIPF
jgi:hypothetical protein